MSVFFFQVSQMFPYESYLESGCTTRERILKVNMLAIFLSWLTGGNMWLLLAHQLTPGLTRLSKADGSGFNFKLTLDMILVEWSQLSIKLRFNSVFDHVKIDRSILLIISLMSCSTTTNSILSFRECIHN